MLRFYLILFALVFHSSFSYAEESKFKFTFGSNVGNIPFEIKKMNQNIKNLQGIKIYSWTLSPNISSFVGNKKLFNFSEDKILRDKVYIKFKLRF